MFDAPDAEAALGRSAVAAAMADPLTVTVKKSLLVFISIGISSLSSLGPVGVPIVRKIDNDRLWRTSHNCPSKWMPFERLSF
jgi:hypothetical protein